MGERGGECEGKRGGAYFDAIHSGFSSSCVVSLFLARELSPCLASAKRTEGADLEVRAPVASRSRPRETDETF